jgi:gamma-glutamyltranspeptidase/glutathione hydrolase
MSDIASTRRRVFGLALLLGLFWLAPAGAERPQPPVAAIASAHSLATDAGHEILAAGGNAFDAAVTVAAVLGVVEPHGSGLGGGGFFLLHRARDGFETMLDARERAPLTASEEMYLDAQRHPIAQLSRAGPLAAAVPGQPAALVHLAEKFGRLPLKHTLAPAIELARKGVPTNAQYRRLAQLRREALTASPEASGIFLDEGFGPTEGFVLKQPDLANTLEQLAKKGRSGFYEGRIAQALVQGVRAAGGIWSLKDLAEYQLEERAPMRGSYRGMQVTTASLPSSGGVVLLQMLGLVAPFDIEKLDASTRVQTLVEAMRLAYRDRAAHLGDPDFVDVDVDGLLAAEYLSGLRAELRRNLKAPPSAALLPQDAAAGRNTTHFSILDREGNRVAATLSINSPFGSGFVPPGTGVLLNNEMDDFVAKPGVANLYGLTGSRANLIAPGKRPLSSMTPTFLETPEVVVLLGTPGGSRIITMVLLAGLEVAAGRGGVRDWVELRRFHHQHLPDVIEHETGALGGAQIQELKRRGYRLDEKANPYGNMQAVVWYKDENRVAAASDPRGDGAARVETASAGDAEE